MADRLLELSRRPEAPSARATLPFDRLAKIVEVPTTPPPAERMAQVREQPIPLDRVPTKNDHVHKPEGYKSTPTLGGGGQWTSQLQPTRRDETPAPAPAPAAQIDPHQGRSLAEALQSKPDRPAPTHVDRLAAVLAGRPTPQPTGATPTPTRSRDDGWD